MRQMMKNFALPALLLVCFSFLSGCPLFGWLAQGAVGTKPPPVKVHAEYHGLENQTVAVLVDADQALLFQNPLAQYEVSAAISLRLAAGVPGIKVIDAKQVADFQNANIYWNTTKYSELAKKLGATRLMIVDLIDYRLHDAGDVNIWKGVASAKIDVAETDGAKPNDLAYTTNVSVAYPPDKPQGLLNSDAATMRFGLLDLLSRGVAGKFHETMTDEPDPLAPGKLK